MVILTSDKIDHKTMSIISYKEENITMIKGQFIRRNNHRYEYA